MQPCHGPSVTGAINNNTVGGPSIRDTVRSDSSSVSTNFQLNSRLVNSYCSRIGGHLALTVCDQMSLKVGRISYFAASHML